MQDRSHLLTELRLPESMALDAMSIEQTVALMNQQDAVAVAAMAEKAVGPNDVVMGIAAGGTTPFVHGALRRARALGAKTIFLSCVQPTPNEADVDVAIRPLTGPEVITGSTRLKAGTATKLV